MSASGHAKFSASGAYRWLSCPGSIALCAKAPPQADSKYAAEGTQAHTLLERMLKGFGVSRIAEHPTEMLLHARSAADWIIAKRAATESAELLCETKVDSSPFTCEGQFGTVDAAVVQEFGRLTVIDFKYGAGVAVDPEDNPQLIYYALGLSHQYHHNFTEVELVIIQPRAHHHTGETVRSVVMPMDELLSWRQKFQLGVLAAQDPQAPLRSGSWCRWCAAAPICPQLKNRAMEQAQIVFDDLTGIESVPEPRMIQIPHLGIILEACDRLEDWIGNVREHAFMVLQRGEQVAGFKLVEKRATRKWRDEDIVGAEARRAFGEAAFTEPKLLSPAQMAKVAKREWIDAHTVSESSGLTLVHESDKRPAVQSLENVFDVVPDPPSLPVMLSGKIPHVRTKKRK